MNSIEFREQLDRLRTRYGQKAYDDDFAKILWRDIRHFSDGILQKVVDLIITEHFRPIGKSAILEIMKQESAKRGGVQFTKKIIPDDCVDCNGDGLVFLYDLDDRKYVFSCGTCRNGTMQRELGGRAAPHINVAASFDFHPKGRRSYTFGEYPCPWPNALVGLLMGFKDPRGLSKSGLRFVGIDKDEAEYLYQRYLKKDWDDIWAKEIIAKSKSKRAIADLVGR